MASYVEQQQQQRKYTRSLHLQHQQQQQQQQLKQHQSGHNSSKREQHLTAYREENQHFHRREHQQQREGQQLQLPLRCNLQFDQRRSVSKSEVRRKNPNGWRSWWHISSPLLNFAAPSAFLQLLLLLTFQNVASGEGNIGCHFVRTLCVDGREVCFNDNIFGKCIPTTGVDVEDIERSPLSEEQSRTLATMLEEMQGAGLGWDHPYVQCRIQGALYMLQKHAHLPPSLCANLAPTPSEIDPSSPMAFVRFKPPIEDYVDQLYYPPLKKQTNSDGINTIFHQLQLQDRRSRHDPSELAHFGKIDSSDKPPNSPNVMDAFLENERTARVQEEAMEREVDRESEKNNEMRSRMELYHILAASEPDPQPYQRNTPSAMEELEKVVEEAPVSSLHPPEEIAESHEQYFPEYRAPYKRIDGDGSGESLNRANQAMETMPEPLQRSFFRQLASEQGLLQQPINHDYFSHAKVAPRPEEFQSMPTSKRIADNDEAEKDIKAQNRIFEESLFRNSLTPFEEEAMLASNSYPSNHKLVPEHVFTEGGLVYVPESQLPMDAEEAKKEEARELLANMLGFTRHERLDVKKPGPLIGPPSPPPQKTNVNEQNEQPNMTHKTNNNNNSNKAETKEVLPAHIKSSDQASKKKKIFKGHSDLDHAPHSVDTEYAHVYVRNHIDSWDQGVRIMNALARSLNMQGYFSYLTVEPHQVSFRVDSNNPEGKTATDIANAINQNSGVILRRLGFSVINAGVGNKVQLIDDDDQVPSRPVDFADPGPDVTHIMAYMFAGAGAAAVIVIFVTLILIKRHDKKRDKLGGLQTSGGTGAESCSKDYQDLCRARMAGKGSATEPAASGRITSLSKENDRPPSSRSSTSSWCEEPALTNMDISTGHMVLSYMEDHLRNKGRLQREWEALCRYEAEPSARDAALEQQCAQFNRPGAPLPYDHSRVVLNHLANAEGLDYINASTITDHDPRAPAYVAAQGPLPTTLSHFWQMIWEQGAVVIVSLCRLQENGEIACVRYWPEEGAEVYYIYEVHLVSEHIWCDDYLVRSFYLKNLRTSETRTVTQFHFLSWPQGGVPSQAKALLDFRRKVNKSYRGRSCPIVVHSSAGAGRTGAYILLDLVLGRMNKGAREIDIAATLEHLRDQRAGLVATRQQFEFVLMAVAEEVHAILKALPANQSNEKRELEAKDSNGATATLMEEETTESESPAKTKATAKPAEGSANDAKDKGQQTATTTTTTTTTTEHEKDKTKSTPSKAPASGSVKKKK